MYNFYVYSHVNSVSLEEYIMIGISTIAKDRKVSQGDFESPPHRSLSSKAIRVQTFQSRSFLSSPGRFAAVWPQGTFAIWFYLTCSGKNKPGGTRKSKSCTYYLPQEGAVAL